MARITARWKEYFEQHLNEEEERDQPPDQVDLRDEGIERNQKRACTNICITGFSDIRIIFFESFKFYFRT
jgi:hypothetical protein